MQIWGILNLTPDSFYQASRVSSENFTERALAMLAQGADRLDIGAESTRPGSERLSVEEEWSRLGKPLHELKASLGAEKFSLYTSLDTMKPEIALKGLELGVGCINDVSGGNQSMYELVSQYGCKYVLMHTSGDPKIMQDHTQYANLLQEVCTYFAERTEHLISAGVQQSNIIYDYGIGFGKTVAQNIKLLQATAHIRKQFNPLLVGVSRKSFIGKITDEENPENRGPGTEAAHSFLALQGADVLRVHDVPAAMQTMRMIQHLGGLRHEQK